MLLTVFAILVLAAFIVTIASTFTPPRAPLWVAVILLCLLEMLRILPIGKG